MGIKNKTNKLYRMKKTIKVTTIEKQVKKTYNVLRTYYYCYDDNPDQLHYGTPLREVRKIDKWVDFLKELGYTYDYRGSSNKKGEYSISIDYGNRTENGNLERYRTRIWEKDFVNSIVTIEPMIVPLNSIKMEGVLYNLNAEEYIQFLKDNDLQNYNIDYLQIKR